MDFKYRISHKSIKKYFIEITGRKLFAPGDTAWIFIIFIIGQRQNVWISKAEFHISVTL